MDKLLPKTFAVICGCLRSRSCVRLSIVLAFICCASVIYKHSINDSRQFGLSVINLNNIVPHGNPQTDSGSHASSNSSFLEYLENYSKKVIEGNSSNPAMKLIILAMTDNSFVDMALNLYLSSFKRFGIDNFLFVGAGKSACDGLLKLNIQCFYFMEDPTTDQADDYGSTNFIRKMNIRTVMILAALKANFSVLHTDLDVVFLENPMLEIETLLQNTNMAILWDHSVYNAGFLAIKATPFSIEVYENLQSRTNRSASLDDQRALNQALHEMKEKYKDDPVYSSVTILNRDRFMCGKDYFEKNRDFPQKNHSNSCPGCLVIHNNWIVSKEAKVYRFKESNMWKVDNEKYYSDETRKYLMYFNPFIKNPPTQYNVETSEFGALKTGLMLSTMLNRTLIIPRFHCFGANNDIECPLNSWLSVKDFDLNFQYRESSFLFSDLVPTKINMKPKKSCTSDDLRKDSQPNSNALFCNKQGQTNSTKCLGFNPIPILIVTKSNSYLFNHTLQVFPSSTILNYSSHESLEEKIIQDQFGRCSDQVLVLTSLLNVEVTFANKVQGEMFSKTIKSGLIRKSYMQLRRK